MEMDIYMRRRLVALGGLVAFFILFVLLVKSCGGDDDPAPLQTAETGATGANGAIALTPDEFIAEADAICGPANRAVGALDPTDPDAIREEAQITRTELQQLQSFELSESDRQITRFLALLDDVSAGLKSKSAATQRGLTADADEAQIEIDTSEAAARELGTQIGFQECGQFLDAGEAPGDATGTAAETAPTDTGTVAPPTDTGTVAPPTDTGAVPPDDTGTVPPADDTGGITP